MKAVTFLVALVAGCVVIAQATAQEGTFELVVLPQGWADQYGAKCLDGTPPAYWIRRSNSSTNFALFFEGGAWCFDLQDCTGRAKGYLGTSKGLNPTFAPGGILSGNKTENPTLSAYTGVFAHYCDGASFSSYQQAGVATGDPSLPTIWMRGKANREALVAYWQEKEGMKEADTVLVSGGSAGGLAVYYGLDAIASSLSGSKVVGFPDAGYFMDYPNFANGEYEFRAQFQNADASLWNTTNTMGTNKACLAHYTSTGEAWKCLMAPYVAPFITTPFFITNSLLDIYQIPHILGLPCFPPSCNATETQAYLAFAEAMRHSLSSLTSTSHAAGAFADSCFVHEQNVDYCSTRKLPNCVGWLIYKVNGYTVQQATDAFFSSNRSLSLIDDSTWPNNPSCPSPP